MSFETVGNFYTQPVNKSFIYSNLEVEYSEVVVSVSNISAKLYGGISRIREGLILNK
jgi:hypothetical protein